LRALGPAALRDDELVALLLRTGASRRSALTLASSLLGERGIDGLALATVSELCLRSGIGPAKAASIVAAVELGRRLAERCLEPGERIRVPADIHAAFHPRLRGAPQEEFHVVLLDARHCMVRSVLVSRGTLTASLVHPREVFGPALREAAAAVVLVHNHPSGDPSPSAEDRQLTDRLVRVGELLGIPVLDHVIVADRGFASLRELGAFPH